MANQYTLTDAFSAITETQGTLYNVGDSNIELASAADTTPGQGILFPSGARQTFRGTLYARSMDDAATLNVSDFTEGAGGGDQPVLRFCGSVSTYDDLPDDAEQGDVYNVETADPDHGILAGDNVAWDGTAWDRMAGVYAVMTGASASADGAAGLTPQPLQGDEGKFLRGDGTWATEADMTGAAAGTAGAHGLVPAPAAGDNVKFLRGDGTWTQEAIMTGATNAADGEKGLVPKPITGDEGKFLRGDGTFAHEATMTGATSAVAGAGGLVPAPAAGDDTKFLSGDGTYKQEAVYTGATAGAAGVKGLVPPASLGDVLSFLRSDGTWANEPQMVGATASTAGAAGLVPAPAAGDNAKVLAGDGTYKQAVMFDANGNIDAPEIIASHNNLFRGQEITDTWAEINAKAVSGAADYYIGDYKEIELAGGEKVVMEIAGISNYEGALFPESGPYIDFISRHSMSQSYQYNSTATNNGTSAIKSPWLSSDLCGSLNNETTGVYSKLPSDLQSVIIPKRANLEERYSSGGAATADTGMNWVDMGKIWLPTELEVFGHVTWSEPGFGTGGGILLQYPIFLLSSSRIVKKANNARDNWWLCSAISNDSSKFCYVDSYGAPKRNTATYSFNVPLCFRVGKSS